MGKINRVARRFCGILTVCHKTVSRISLKNGKIYVVLSAVRAETYRYLRFTDMHGSPNLDVPSLPLLSNITHFLLKD